MASRNELLFGTIAVQLGCVNSAQVTECVRTQVAPETIVPRPLGLLLVGKKYLQTDDVSRVLREQANRLKTYPIPAPHTARGEPLGQILTREGFINRYQLNECLRLQATYQEDYGLPMRLGELMVRKGYMTREQVRLAVRKQVSEVLACPRCGAQVKQAPPKGKKTVPCGRCSAALEPMTPSTEKTSEDVLLQIFHDRTSKPKVVVEPIPEEIPILAPEGGVSAAVLVAKEAFPLAEDDLVPTGPESTRRVKAHLAERRARMPKTMAPVQDPLRVTPEEFAVARKDPTRRFEGFVLVRRLFRGPRAEVFVGVREGGGDPAIVKRMTPGALATAADSARWVEGNRRLARVRSPLSLRILGLGQAGGQPYAVYDPIPLLGLDFLRAQGILSAKHAWSLGEALLAALASFHAQGIVHGNLKLANILLDSQAAEKGTIDQVWSKPGGLVLMDFGLPPMLSAISPAAGCPPPAPEQTDRRIAKWDARVDVHAVGELLSGLLAGTDGAKRRTGDPERASFLARATAPDRDRRYGHAAEMLTVLRQIRP